MYIYQKRQSEDKMNENELLITEYEAGQRLDKFLLKYFNDASPGFVYKMLRKKRIKLNGRRAEGSEILTQGNELRFYISPETMDQFMSARKIGAGCDSSGDIDVIYEDENILAVNKPRGLLTHPTTSVGQLKEDTLIDRCLAYLLDGGVFLADKTSVFTPAFCNRLDRNTSGIVLCGKNPAAMRELNRSVAGRCIEKYYLAVVIGRPPAVKELVSYHWKDATANRASIVEAAGKFTTQAGDENPFLDCQKRIERAGKEMVTGITTLTTNHGYSLLSVKLVTGRSHQIRAQLSAIGHPIVGDSKYGGKTSGVEWQLLHAERVVFAGLFGVLEYLNGMELYAPPDQWFMDRVRKLVGEGIFAAKEAD